jgi:hypothetical protein
LHQVRARERRFRSLVQGESKMKRTKKTLSNTEMKSLETTELAAATGGYIINGLDDGDLIKIIHLGGGINNGLLNGLINGIPGPGVGGGGGF